MTNGAVDWAAIGKDPRFQEFRRRKRRFLGGLVAAAVGYFFMLPFGAAYFRELFRIQVMGVVNIGILFALSQFLVVLIVAALYAWRANRDFDRLSEEISREILAQHVQGRQA